MLEIIQFVIVMAAGNEIIDAIFALATAKPPA
jgi:hypothetical protein